MKHERDLYSERAYVQYLNKVIHDLRTQIQAEKLKRIACEEAQAQAQAMFLQGDLDVFSCVRILTMMGPTAADRHQGRSVYRQCFEDRRASP
jgi:hypothetical protein